LDAVPAGLLTNRPVLPTYGGMFNLPYPHPRLPIVNAFNFELIADLVETYGWPRETLRNMIAPTWGLTPPLGSNLSEELLSDVPKTQLLLPMR
jgi:hypothetical protein